MSEPGKNGASVPTNAAAPTALGTETAHAFLAPKLLALVGTARAELARVVAAGDDPEALHDFRVALRRLRTMSRVVRALYGKRQLRALGDELRTYAAATGRVREEEVLRETLAALVVDPPTRADLDGWIARRERAGRGARSAVLALLRGVPPRNERRPPPRREVGHALDALAKRIARGPKKRAGSAAEHAREVTLRALDDLAAHAGADPSDVVGMHELRIRFKRLRYTLELVGAALPDGAAALAKGATKLQKRLGDLHDADDAIGRVRRAWGLPPASRSAVLAALGESRARLAARAAEELRAELERHAAFREGPPHGTPVPG